MTTARSVPVTSEDADGHDEPDVEDALHLLRQHGVLKIAHGAILRFRHGDGYSHSRALALQLALSVIPFLLALTGLAADLHEKRASGVLAQTIARVSPGSGSSDALAAAVTGSDSSSHAGVVALLAGLVLSFGSMTIAMGQVERGSNRIFGHAGERPTRAKYTHAARLAAGLAPLLGAGFLLLVAGGDFARAADDAYHWHAWWRTTYAVGRWPLGIALLVVALTVLLDRAPERRQPTSSWLVLGTATSLVIVLVATTALAGYTKASGTFGQTYGPLAGVMALLVWSLMCAVALFYGVAVCAQLEALHAGEEDPTEG